MKPFSKQLVVLLFLNINLLAFGYYFLIAKPNLELLNKQEKTAERLIKSTCLNATLLPEFKNETVKPPGRFTFSTDNYIYLEAEFKECIK